MPWCLIVDSAQGRRRIPLSAPGTVLVGSDPACQISIDQPTLSRQHLALHLSDTRLEIEDLGSRNGSFVDNRRLEPGVAEPVQAATSIRLGDVEVRIARIDDDDATPLTPTSAPEKAAPGGSANATFASGSGDRFVRQHLPVLLNLAASRPGATAMLLAYANACAQSLPLRQLRLTGIDGGIIFDWHPDEVAGGNLVELVRDQWRWTIGTDQPLPADRLQYVAEIGAGLARLASSESQSTAKSAAAPAATRSLDAQVQRIYRRATRVADSDIHVLIRGESGTGKELLARHIHQASARRDGPFVAINCAAFSEEMLEAELFGVVRGAATGVDARAGMFERADRGTLFLDEIGDMAAAMQARILRVLQEREVLRVGGSTPVKVDVRVISATHCDIETMLADGRFRPDLIHRIADWEVELPPLRDRPSDILPLAMTFLLRSIETRGLTIRGLSRAAANALLAYEWPGNIRELEREMARVAVFLDQDSLVMSEDLRANIRSARQAGDSKRLDQQLARAERNIVAQAMLAAGQQTTLAAEQLGISRSTLYRRLRDFDLLPEGADADAPGNP